VYLETPAAVKALAKDKGGIAILSNNKQCAQDEACRK
jgi:hypothetical protein